ncbi:MAG: hypothetical protein MUF53_04060 [Gemmatimonadaceae bacterium]|nr:hypothetical protein [Gemmatimonadaceae bacterium]
MSAHGNPHALLQHDTEPRPAHETIPMVRYDPQVIQTFADALYRRAAFITYLFAGIGAVIGLAAGSMKGGFMTFLAAAILGIAGYVIGLSRSLSLKLLAQTALCQVEIEKNTRRTP